MQNQQIALLFLMPQNISNLGRSLLFKEKYEIEQNPNFRNYRLLAINVDIKNFSSRIRYFIFNMLCAQFKILGSKYHLQERNTIRHKCQIAHSYILFEMNFIYFFITFLVVKDESKP